MQQPYLPPNRYYRPTLEPEPPRRRWRLHMAGGLLLLVVASAIYVAWPHAAIKAHAVARPVRSPQQEQQAMAAMDMQVQSIVSANPAIDIAVTAVNLRTGAARNYGTDVPFEGASIGKLITAAAFLHQVEHGTEHLNTALEDGNAAQTDLRQMIVVSDDDAWVALNDELGRDAITSYAAAIGLTDYDASENNLKTEDIAVLLQKLYDGNLLSAAHRGLLLGYMKQANYRDFIVPVIPANAVVYHKVGLLDDRIHDAAIIDDGSNRVALVIFTNGHGVYDDVTRQHIIQSITKAVLAGYDIR